MSDEEKLLSAAVALFEDDVETAYFWLKQPVLALGGKSPENVPLEDALDLIGRLEHGIVT